MKIRRVAQVTAAAWLSAAMIMPVTFALGSQQNPQSGSMGLEGTVQGVPPTQAATIESPVNGQVFTSTPVTINGLCKTGLLVKVFSNNIFVGSVLCVSGSFNLKVDLFSGHNDLVAQVYDTLDQQGPDSNTVSVTFNDAQFAKFGTHVSLTSSYARRGADPGAVLTWPFILSGGTGPYALSFDWGDSSGNSLMSVSFPGIVNATHTYNQAGTYTIVAKVTDANGTSSYLQVVGVANGKISGSVSSSTNSQSSTTKTIILWQPILATLPLLLITFWLGRRHELYAIRRSLEMTRRDF